MYFLLRVVASGDAAFSRSARRSFSASEQACAISAKAVLKEDEPRMNTDRQLPAAQLGADSYPTTPHEEAFLSRDTKDSKEFVGSERIQTVV